MDHDMQVMPEQSSDERMHVLNRECWCNPSVEGDTVRHHAEAA